MLHETTAWLCHRNVETLRIMIGKLFFIRTALFKLFSLEKCSNYRSTVKHNVCVCASAKRARAPHSYPNEIRFTWSFFLPAGKLADREDKGQFIFCPSVSLAKCMDCVPEDDSFIRLAFLRLRLLTLDRVFENTGARFVEVMHPEPEHMNTAPRYCTKLHETLGIIFHHFPKKVPLLLPFSQTHSPP